LNGEGNRFRSLRGPAITARGFFRPWSSPGVRLALGPPGRNGPSGATISDAGVLIPVDAFLAKPFTVERPLNKVRERIEYCSPFSRPSSLF